MNIIWFKDCSYKKKELVGGKNASLGELYNVSKQLNFNIANGFAITTNVYNDFIEYNHLLDPIVNIMKSIDIDDIQDLNDKSEEIKELFNKATFNQSHVEEIVKHYSQLKELYSKNIEVAVRSSAIAEDLPNASFAGQQDTYLNIQRDDELIQCIKQCFASLFNSRAISYRKTNNIAFKDVKISVGIQKMIRSDIGSAGVAFSLDPETGYDKAIVINAAFGLGELVVSGGIKPDEIIIDKRTLKIITADPIVMKSIGDKHTKIVYSNEGVEQCETNLIEKINISITNNQAIELAKSVLLLEENYSKLFNKKIGIDVEWALDGIDNQMYIIQTRPETIHSTQNNLQELQQYTIQPTINPIVCGVSVGEKVSSGKIKCLNDISEFKLFEKGDILVTDMTTPDWEPLMKISSGIITNKGGRTCHAAIVARELEINAIVGSGNATDILNNQQLVTMSCAEGEIGKVYEGEVPYQLETFTVDTHKKLPVQLMLNVGSPEIAFTSSRLPHQGVGLARLEFIINNYVKIHPLALLDYPNIREDIRVKIKQIIGHHDDGKWYFIKRLARGMGKIASAFYPQQIIIRLSDFKSNEYSNLLGGNLYEPLEENPMIGWRGASRYYSKEYIKAFELECLAIKYARETMHMDNITVMIPFCRTPDECEKVISTMKQFGLTRGENNLKIFLMCEIPSNVIEADLFSKHIDGVSIGGNDLLQLTLGIDRDSEKITNIADHTNISYRRMISQAIQTYKKHGIKVGFCGQQPSDSIDFCNFLIQEGIDSISVTPDSILKTYLNL